MKKKENFFSAIKEGFLIPFIIYFELKKENDNARKQQRSKRRNDKRASFRWWYCFKYHWDFNKYIAFYFNFLPNQNIKKIKK